MEKQNNIVTHIYIKVLSNGFMFEVSSKNKDYDGSTEYNDDVSTYCETSEDLQKQIDLLFKK